MELTFTSEQQMMRKMVREFAADRVQGEVKRMEEEKRFPAELIKEMAELGLMGIPVPEKYGGAPWILPLM